MVIDYKVPTYNLFVFPTIQKVWPDPTQIFIIHMKEIIAILDYYVRCNHFKMYY